MRLTKFLGRKCKVCMRILLLKSLLLCTNCPSFLPILRGFLFVFVVESFLFLPWMPLCIFRGILFVFCRGFLLFCRGIFFVSAVDSFCFCSGFLCVYSFFLFVFLFSPLFLLLSPTKSEKRGRFFGKSPSFFGANF